MRPFPTAPDHPPSRSPQHRLRGSLAFALALLAASCSSPDSGGDLPPPRIPAARPPAGPSVSSTFAVKDTLELLVEEDPSFSGSYPVRDGGYVLIPKVGRVQVLGLSRADAETRIKEALQKQQLKQATVFVERQPNLSPDSPALSPAAARLNVILTGAVVRPGQHSIPLPADGREVGVYEALLLAGGLSKFADLAKIKVMRLDGGGVRRAVSLNARKIQDGTAADLPLGDGDIVNVPEKVFGF
jgi:protein involved in polysaccharide export with SLBB domain